MINKELKKDNTDPYIYVGVVVLSSIVVNKVFLHSKLYSFLWRVQERLLALVAITKK